MSTGDPDFSTNTAIPKHPEYVHFRQKPSVGRIVHYYCGREFVDDDGKPVAEPPQAAIITGVNDYTPEAESHEFVNLTVFGPHALVTSAFGVPVKDRADGSKVFWEWPPRV